jgi:nucleotide-binding universal stress UspA family protein
MSRILLAVDGSECSGRAVRHVIDLAKAMKSAPEVEMISVQPALKSGDVRMFISRETIEGYQREEGDKALASARAALDAAGVAYSSHIMIGQVAPSIAEFARQHECGSIVMGTRGLGGVSGLILGSVASQVIHLSTVPITLIK